MKMKAYVLEPGVHLVEDSHHKRIGCRVVAETNVTMGEACGKC
jgi:hypothetical protein